MVRGPQGYFILFKCFKVGKSYPVRFVFLMKFVNDFLAFLDPFSGAKEIVAEKANDALEGATKNIIDAYVNSTRVRLVSLKIDVLVRGALQ